MLLLLHKSLKGSRNIQGFALIRAVLLKFQIETPAHETANQIYIYFFYTNHQQCNCCNTLPKYSPEVLEEKMKEFDKSFDEEEIKFWVDDTGVNEEGEVDYNKFVKNYTK